MLNIDRNSLPLPRREIYRYLGYKNARQVSPRTRKMVEEQLAAAGRWLSPRAVYRIIGREDLAFRQHFKDARQVALAICTAGEALEERIQGLFHQGSAAEAVILDAIGSVAAEAVAEVVNREIDTWARQRGLHTTRRFSPGYGDWPVEDQEFVFSHFPPEPAGVRLSPGGMMLPRKSVSFAVKIGERPMQEVNPGRCASCQLHSRCAYRDDRRCAL